MPCRYILFSILVLGSAFGASKMIVTLQDSAEEAKTQNARPPTAKRIMVEDEATAKTLSGSSIAPGGVGGRQSQFSAMLRNNHS
jgi:hypothetical protein